MYAVKNFKTTKEFVNYNNDFIYSNPMQNILLINVIDEIANNNLRAFQAFNIIGNVDNQILVLIVEGYCLIYCIKYDADFIEFIRSELPFDRLENFIFAGDKQSIENLLILQGLKYLIEKHLIIYKCVKLNSEFKMAEGKMRLAKIHELNYLTKLSVEFTDEYDGNRENYNKMQMSVLSEIHNKSLYVWEDGKICSIAVEMNRMESPEIGKLYTVSAERKNGYSSSLLFKLTKKILSKKPLCMLYTHGENPASNRTVLKIGYVKIGDYARISLIN